MGIDTPGHHALAHIDQVLAERPKKNDHLLSQATLCLTAFRDHLIAHWRQGGITPVQRRQLGHVNAVITVVLGVHFPLGEIPWDELEKARSWLADAVDAEEPVAANASRQPA